MTAITPVSQFPLLTASELANADMCAICHDDLHEGRKLCCGHAFHTGCLGALLERFHDCPVCRRKIEPPFDFASLPRFRALLDRSNGLHKPYQYRGVHWLLDQERQGLGGLLADEMGLGKTITLIGTMIENYKSHTLIVTPVALLNQWRDAIFHFTGHRALVFHASAPGKRASLEELQRAPIVLSTYGTISVRSKCPCLSVLHKILWDRVVFDEAHHLRTHTTSKHHGASMLKSPIKWMVTGTPIQNRRSDIVALGALLGLSDTQLISKHMLRRTKRDVGAELLPVVSENLYVSWQDEHERQLAEDIHSQSQVAFGVVSSIGGAFGQHIGEHLAALTRAKQMCTAPALLTRPVRRVFEEGHIGWSHQHAGAALGVRGTSKLTAVLDHITKGLENNANKLVFCTYHAEIDFLKQGLRNAGAVVGVKDGRHTDPNAFEEAQVLILQTQSCSEGLNLQRFSEVYFVTPHWNPFVEEQAIARCHRIGQSQRVRVFRFLMRADDFQDMEGDERGADTFDTCAQLLQNDKRQLASFLLNGHDE